jgi:hypothetical protein
MVFQITEKNPYQKSPKFQAFWIKDTINLSFLLIKLTGTSAIQVIELVYCGNKVNNTHHGGVKRRIQFS